MNMVGGGSVLCEQRWGWKGRRGRRGPIGPVLCLVFGRQCSKCVFVCVLGNFRQLTNLSPDPCLIPFMEVSGEVTLFEHSQGVSPQCCKGNRIDIHFSFPCATYHLVHGLCLPLLPQRSTTRKVIPSEGWSSP